jgi:diguanylate cyclase (GGDEF)-like protein
MLGLTVRGRIFIVVIAVLLGAAAWGAGRLVASIADRSQVQIADTQQLSTTLLGEETAAATFWLSGRKTPQELANISVYAGRYEAAFKKAQRDVGTSGQMGVALADVNRLALAWRRSARRVTAMMNNPNQNVYPSDRLLRGTQALMTKFREANTQLQDSVDRRSRHDTSLADVWSLLGAIGVALVIAIFGELVLVRRTRHEYAYREAHSAFVDALVLTTDKGSAYELLTERLEQLVKPSRVLVVPHEAPLDEDEPDGEDPELTQIESFTRMHNDNVLERLLRLGDKKLATILIERGSELSHTTAAHVQDVLGAAAPVVATLDNLEDAETLATTDQLTGTANRRALEHSLEHMFAHAMRVQEPFSVIMLDIDHFKRFNDSFGHDSGDAVLRALGAILRGNVRAADVAGRYGGEEFLVLCPNAELSGAASLAMKLHADVSRIVVNDTSVTASFGVASFPESAVDVVELVKAADQALYRAKESGRDRVELAEETTVLD